MTKKMILTGYKTYLTKHCQECSFHFQYHTVLWLLQQRYSFWLPLELVHLNHPWQITLKKQIMDKASLYRAAKI